MNTPLGFLVIGAQGRMGRRRCASVRARNDARLVAELDLGDDYRSWLGRSDIDVVVVCTPNVEHCAMVTDALAARKHVFCEKPLGVDPRDAATMVRAAQESGRTLKVGANLRYFGSVQRSFGIVRSGLLGRILFVRATIGHAGETTVRHWFARVAEAGGGTFLDNGCHVLDLVHELAGPMATCVGASRTLCWPQLSVEDNAVAVFESPSAMAVVHASWSEWAPYARIEVYGTDAALHIDVRAVGESLVRIHRDGTFSVEQFETGGNSYDRELDDYVRTLLAERAPSPSGEDGWRVVAMAHALYESSRTGRRMEISSCR